jgi:hypothetical protein
VQELCSIANVERARRLPPEIPTHEVLIGTSPLVRDTLTAELVARHPASFPLVPELESLLPHQHGTDVDGLFHSDPFESP